MSQPKPHVIMIAYHLRPSTEMGAIRPSRFRKYLTRMGYPCHVITASPQGENCPADITYIADPLRALWDGTTDGRRNFRAYVELAVRKAMFPGHLAFVWAGDAAAAARKIIAEHPGEKFVLFTTYPPMGVLVAGLMIRLRHKLPWIADFRDPMIGVPKELFSLNTRFWSRVLEEITFRLSDAVIANVETAGEVWRQRYPWAKRKLHVIYNGFDPEESPKPREIPARDHKLLVHAGALYKGRNANVMIEALARLKKTGAPEARSAKILQLGMIDPHAGADRALYDEAQRDGWLESHPPVSWNEWEEIVGQADGLLLAQPQSSVQAPGKLYAYICIGRPILALLPHDSAVEPILKNSGVAHVCIYSDDQDEVIDRKFVEFLRLPNTANPINEWFRTNFHVESHAQRLAGIIDEITK